MATTNGRSGPIYEEPKVVVGLEKRILKVCLLTEGERLVWNKNCKRFVCHYAADWKYRFQSATAKI